jgi:transposase-like protein
MGPAQGGAFTAYHIVQIVLRTTSEDITQALWGTRVSPCTVSNVNQKIYERIEKWCNRPIDDSFAYVYLDSIVLKRTWMLTLQ